ncbi:hypothetical protein D9M71_722410 [compost metagenome]
MADQREQLLQLGIRKSFKAHRQGWTVGEGQVVDADHQLTKQCSRQLLTFLPGHVVLQAQQCREQQLDTGVPRAESLAMPR